MCDVAVFKERRFTSCSLPTWTHRDQTSGACRRFTAYHRLVWSLLYLRVPLSDSPDVGILRNGLRRWPTTTLLCVVGVMFVVTTIHWAASMLNVLDELDLVICDSGIPCVSGDESQTCPPLILQPSGRDRLPLQYCAWSAALTTNVAVFGSIVYRYGMH
ncbi:hypothetical protein BD310DRAFT_927584 [Dichomitus squalens]|uniref:Uncharacterized protein n=1 Tax=Dichomitus squalens TaxID=114155 RepID=A0A4Q9PUJ1_9APHY|nr:hypothetical protein BD310DRAFT_927584 [Dichomitus squalens]